MRQWLSYKLFSIGEYSITNGEVLGLFVLFALVWLILKILKFVLSKIKRFDSGGKHAVYQLVQYVILIISILLSFEILGFNWNLIVASSAALLVGIGLGLQNLFNDFISGVIILIDGTIKVNHVIQFENATIGKVVDIKLRTTTIMDRNGIYIVVPNRKFTADNVINWTLREHYSRFIVSVGVDYSSDLDKVKEILLYAAESHKASASIPKPIVRISDFADSSIAFELLFWSKDIFYMDNFKAEMRWQIIEAFRKEGVTIPFPQRTVHMNSSIK